MAPPEFRPLRLAFAGTPEFAVPTLRALSGSHHVVAAYCQPPRPTGRGRKVVACPVEKYAHELGIRVFSPASLRGEVERLSTFDLDALIVVAYGKLLPRSVLPVPRYGCINVHASLLPRWRGAAPIERAIMAGDRITGISIMQMDEGLDTGPLLHQVSCPILPDDTGDTLRDRLAALGAEALLACLANPAQWRRHPQADTGATYAAKLTPDDSRIDWTRSAREVAAQIRALNSRQPATCMMGADRARLLEAVGLDEASAAAPGSVVAVDKTGLSIACGHGTIRVTRIGLARGSGRPMDIAALLNGYPELFMVGQVLDAPA
jgi:methionyl-tRNA formyltransferase